METLEIELAEHPCLKGLSPKYIKTIFHCASDAKFEAKQLIFHKGDPANSFFLIRQGRVGLEVDVPQKGTITIETVGPGELLGWSWLIPPYKCHFNARAYELTKAIVLDGGYLREKCQDDHELGYELYSCFIDIIVERLHSVSMQFVDSCRALK